MTVPAIDIHAHVVCQEAARLVEDEFRPEFDPFTLFADHASTEWNATYAREFAELFFSPSRRVEEMDRYGVDVQILSPTPQQYYYWAPPQLALQAARLHNDYVASFVAHAPDRFRGMATLPLQDVDLAIEELERAVTSLGIVGVQIGTNVAGVDLDDERFVPLWQALESLEVPVFLHPHGFPDGRRLARFYLQNIIGNPLDSTVALSRLMLSGRLEQFPRLEVCIAHGGGFLPFYASRMDHAWSHRPEVRAALSRPPSQALRDVYVDSLVYTPSMLRSLVAVVGADRVMLGTDFPFDMGMFDPVSLLDSVSELSEGERDNIRGRTALRLFAAHPRTEGETR